MKKNVPFFNISGTGIVRNTLIVLLVFSALYVHGQGTNCTANAGGNAVVCGSTTTLTGTVTGVTGTGNPSWTFISGPVTPNIVSPNTLTTNITGMTADGNYVFQLSRACGTGTATSTVTITAHPRPAGFTAGPDIINICATTGTTTLSGVIPAGFNGTWRSINIYSLGRFGTVVSTNSQFSSTTVAAPVFSLVNKTIHDIDPAYYVILNITSADGVCSYEDTAIVRFIPNPVLVPVDRSVCRTLSEEPYIDLNTTTSPNFATAITGAAGTVAAGTTVTLNLISAPAGGTLSFNRISENRRMYVNGLQTAGVYQYTLTISNACSTYTTPTATYTLNGFNPQPLNFQPAGHGAPEQLVVYASGSSGGELHCSAGMVGSSTPERFYFDVNSADDPAQITTSVVTSGTAPPGGFPSVGAIGGTGLRNRWVDITPPSGGWQVGTYKFTLTTSWNGQCGITQSYYIHISDNSRPKVTVPDVSICYPGTGAVSVPVTLPAVYKGVVNSSYFQDLGAYYNFSVISKPAGSGTPVYTATNLRSITSTNTTISNLTTAGDYTFRIVAFSGNGAGPFLDQEYACSGTALADTFVVHVENPTNANAGSDQSVPCSQPVSLLGNTTGSGSGLWSLITSPSGSSPVLSNYTIVNPLLTGTTIQGAYTYSWTITSQYGSCASKDTVAFNIGAPGDDYGDLTAVVWPVAHAAQTSCQFTNGRPNVYNAATNPTTSVWAGNQLSTEYATVNGGNASANTDLYDDGLTTNGSAYITPGTSYPFTLMLNANRPATSVFFRVWIDWNDNGNFADDVDAVNGQGGNATYAGNATVTTAQTTVPYVFNVTAPLGVSNSYKIRIAVSNAAIADVYRTVSPTTVLALTSGEIEDYHAPVPVCNAQSAPALSRTSVTNICPATTADLSTITASNQNANVKLAWHSGTPATNSNKMVTVTAVGAGTYYAAFYDSVYDCYSTATTAVAVTVNTCYTVSGSVFHDVNGNVTKDAGDTFTSLPFPMYVYLVNSSGIVVDWATVDANGNYHLDVNSGANYTIELSAVRYPVGTNTLSTPIDNTLASQWTNTGENANGSIDGIPNGTLTVSAVSGDLTNYNFGIQQAPTTDVKAFNVAESSFSNTPPPGYPAHPGYKSMLASSAALTGYPTGGSLSGSDPEDCTAAGTCNTGSSFAITTINSNTKLFYDYGGGRGVEEINVSSGPVIIPNFNPGNLLIAGLKGQGGAGNPIGFTYALVDQTGALGNSAGYTIQSSTPLPVSLMYFNVYKHGHTARLEWQTSDEKNNKGFEIQRSTDAAGNWNAIGFTESSSYNASGSKYQYTDGSPLENINYYRLKQVDLEGNYRYTAVRTVNFDISDISLTPNPVSSELTINGLSGINEILLKNTIGKQLSVQRTQGRTVQINMTELPAGVYFITIKKEDGSMDNYSILKK